MLSENKKVKQHCITLLVYECRHKDDILPITVWFSLKDSVDRFGENDWIHKSQNRIRNSKKVMEA